MKNKMLEIEEKRHLEIVLTNGFIIEGFYYNDFWIEWWIYNTEYGIKQHLFTIEKDFDIKKYIRENYHDIAENYIDIVESEG